MSRSRGILEVVSQARDGVDCRVSDQQTFGVSHSEAATSGLGIEVRVTELRSPISTINT